MEEAALNLLQGRTPVIPTLHESRPDRPVTLEAEEAVMGIVVEGVRNSEESLVDQADPEGLEAGTQTRAVTRAAAQPKFTEAGMSRAQKSRGAS